MTNTKLATAVLKAMEANRGKASGVPGLAIQLEASETDIADTFAALDRSGFIMDGTRLASTGKTYVLTARARNELNKPGFVWKA